MLRTSKICAAVLLAILRLLAGLLPLKIDRKLNNLRNDQVNRRERMNNYLSLILCFGAGLLLSTCFIHMIPEVRHSFIIAVKAGGWHNLEELPIAEVSICLGFFIVYLLEELGERLVQHSHSRNVSSSESDENEVNAESRRLNNHNHSAHVHSHTPAAPLDEENPVGTAIRGCLLTAALSFHSVFEGMAIGLQTSENDVWFLFTAVVVHELAIMFCIGMEMLASKLKVVFYIVYMIELGLITSVGVAIGIAVTENSANPSVTRLLVLAVLQGIAAGTLLYVTFLEVLERERRKPGNGLIKFGAILLGFTLLSSLEILAYTNKSNGNGNRTAEAIYVSTVGYETAAEMVDLEV